MKDCILPQKLDELFKNIRESGQTPRSLIADMSREDRIAFLSKYIGEERANMVNDLWEQKYIVPQQQEALTEWAGYDNPVVNRIRRLDRALDPADPDLYFEELVQEKLGMRVGLEDAKTLHEYQIAIDEQLASLNKSLGRNYLDMWTEADKKSLTPEQKQMATILGLYVNRFNKFYQDVFEKQADKLPGAKADRIMGTTRTAILSVDTSFTRNISNLFWSDAKSTLKSWAKGQKLFWNELWNGQKKDAAGNTLEDYFWAEIYSDPNYLNGTFKELGVPLGIVEEQFISSRLSDTSLQEGDNKVGRVAGKVLGKETGEKVGKAAGKLLRGYSASEHAFEGAVSFARFSAVNTTLETLAHKQGITRDKAIALLKQQNIGKQVNEATGRWTPENNATLPPALMKKVSNWVLAFRWTASRIATAKNIIYAPAIFAGRTSTGKYFNARNAMRGKAAIGQVLVMGVLSGLQRVASDGEDDDFFSAVEKIFDFKGDFGKFVFWDTRIDMTFGVASFIKMTAQTIDALTNPQYGKDAHDPVARWLSYRVSPQISLAIKAFKQGRAALDSHYLPKDAVGNTETPLEALRSVSLPIWIDNAITYAYDGKNGILEGATASVADFLGFSANTYMDEGKAQIFREWGKRSPLAQLSNQTKIVKSLKGEELQNARDRYEELFLAETYDLYENQKLGDKSEEIQAKALMDARSRILKKLNAEIFGKPKSGAQRRKEKKQQQEANE